MYVYFRASMIIYYTDTCCIVEFQKTLVTVQKKLSSYNPKTNYIAHRW